MARVTINDLEGAVDWLLAYEAADGPIGDNGTAGDDRAEELVRVAEWIKAEIRRRLMAGVERKVARKAGLNLSDPVSRRQVRQAIRRSTTE